MQSVGKFGDGEFDFARGYLYVTVINNISQTVRTRSDVRHGFAG